MQKSEVKSATDVDRPNKNQHSMITSRVTGRMMHPISTGLRARARARQEEAKTKGRK